MIDRLLAEALRAGVPTLEFWDLTPRETVQAIEAAAWRLEEEQRGRLWLAWHVAALSRARRLPSLAQILAPREGKRLAGDELEARRREFAKMKANWQKVSRGD